MSNTVGRIVVVGTILIDEIWRTNQSLSADMFGGIRIDGPFPQNFDGKVTLVDPEDITKSQLSSQFEGNAERMLGGAGGNLVLAVRAIDRAFGVNTHIDFFTRLGHPPANSARAQTAVAKAHEILARNEIAHNETSQGECRIALNTVIEHSSKGRLILKDPIKNPDSFAPGIEQTLSSHIYGADVVFIDPRKFRTGPIAAEACKAFDKRLMVDFGETAWPEDPVLQDAYTRLLKQASIAVVPSDAVIEGMKANTHDPDELFTRLQDQYGCDNILMSNSSKPVRILVDGKEDVIEIEPHQGATFSNGIGDTRNAGLLWALSRGADMRAAFEFGTAIASIKIGHHRNSWQDHILPGILKHPLTAFEDSKAPSWAPGDQFS